MKDSRKTCVQAISVFRHRTLCNKLLRGLLNTRNKPNIRVHREQLHANGREVYFKWPSEWNDNSPLAYPTSQ